MAKTETQAPVQGELVEAQGKGEMVASGGAHLRLPYAKATCEYYDIDQRQWKVLIDSIWPGAQTIEGVCMAIAYCKARGLDPMKRPVHIVPVYSSALKKTVETCWPGINEIRTTASRTNRYAGKDQAEFGETIERTFSHTTDRGEDKGKQETMTLKFPEWCRVTVYKVVGGVRCPFVGPKVYWLESYASKSKWNEIPNDMWSSRTSGQLEKCAEAASLRAAFPEELGNEYTAEEMYGRTIDIAQPLQSGPIVPINEDGTVTPPQPKRSDFARHDAPKPKAEAKAEARAVRDAVKAEDPKPAAAEQAKPAAGAKTEGGPDGRPEPPPVGEAVGAKAARRGTLSDNDLMRLRLLTGDPDLNPTDAEAAEFVALLAKRKPHEGDAGGTVDIPEGTYERLVLDPNADVPSEAEDQVDAVMVRLVAAALEDLKDPKHTRIKDIADVRATWTYQFEGETLEQWNKACDDRQESMLQALKARRTK